MNKALQAECYGMLGRSSSCEADMYGKTLNNLSKIGDGGIDKAKVDLSIRQAWMDRNRPGSLDGKMEKVLASGSAADGPNFDESSREMADLVRRNPDWAKMKTGVLIDSTKYAGAMAEKGPLKVYQDAALMSAGIGRHLANESSNQFGIYNESIGIGRSGTHMFKQAQELLKSANELPGANQDQISAAAKQVELALATEFGNRGEASLDNIISYVSNSASTPGVDFAWRNLHKLKQEISKVSDPDEQQKMMRDLATLQIGAYGRRSDQHARNIILKDSHELLEKAKQTGTQRATEDIAYLQKRIEDLLGAKAGK